MGQLSVERLQRFEAISHLYFDWLTVLRDAGIKDIQDLQGQYLLKCPFHEDKRPSFRIRVHEHTYHCFSCNAYGTVADLMYKMSSQSIPKSQYYEQLLKRSPGMQRELGFSSLFIDAYTLDPGFEGRRKFSAANHIGSGMPISVLGKRVRSMGDTWENLVFSLTMLQGGETPEQIIASMKQIKDVNDSGVGLNEVSLASLIGDLYDD